MYELFQGRSATIQDGERYLLRVFQEIKFVIIHVIMS